MGGLRYSRRYPTSTATSQAWRFCVSSSPPNPPSSVSNKPCTPHPDLSVVSYPTNYEYMCCSGDRPGNRTSASAYVRARQGLLQKDSVIQYVLQAEQGVVSVGNLQPYCGEPSSVHPLQEAPVHRCVTLLGVIATHRPPRLRTPLLRNVFSAGRPRLSNATVCTALLVWKLTSLLPVAPRPRFFFFTC